MIGWLSGILRMRDSEGRLILNVGGVGYVVSVAIGVAGQHEIGQPLELFIHTQVREDDIALFGFEDELGLLTFRALTAVSGVGPKVALAILGQSPPHELAAAVAEGDIATLARAKGVGKRLAERLAVELKGKLDFVPALEQQLSLPKVGRTTPLTRLFDDVRSALGNLGYRPKEIDTVVEQFENEFDGAGPVPDFSELIRKALALLRKP